LNSGLKVIHCWQGIAYDLFLLIPGGKMSPSQKRIAAVTVTVAIAIGAYIFLQPAPSPCRQIRSICESQGYVRGRTPDERKAFQQDCFKPLIEGQSVGNMKVDPAIAQACKERQSKRKNRRGAQPADPDDEAGL